MYLKTRISATKCGSLRLTSRLSILHSPAAYLFYTHQPPPTILHSPAASLYYTHQPPPSLLHYSGAGALEAQSNCIDAHGGERRLVEGEERGGAEGGACVTTPEGRVPRQRTRVRELRFAAMYGFRNVQVRARFSQQV
jgi:hypothetical protein